MKIKYMINNDEMIISLNSLYDLDNDINNLDSIREYINYIIKENNLNFNGKKIVVYQNGLLIGTFYLANYYLKNINKHKKNNLLTKENSFFYETTITEMSPKKKLKLLHLTKV